MHCLFEHFKRLGVVPSEWPNPVDRILRPWTYDEGEGSEKLRSILGNHNAKTAWTGMKQAPSIAHKGKEWLSAPHGMYMGGLNHGSHMVERGDISPFGGGGDINKGVLSLASNLA